MSQKVLFHSHDSSSVSTLFLLFIWYWSIKVSTFSSDPGTFRYQICQTNTETPEINTNREIDPKTHR